MSEERFTGTYVTGSSRAHLNINSATKRAEHTDVFGCPMIGTFNVALRGSIKAQGEPFLTYGKDSYRLVKLRKDKREVYAYAVRWEDSKMPPNRLELLSKRPIADYFKEGDLEVTIFGRWSSEQIQRWQAKLDDKTKWQGHLFWRPERADSTAVWLRMKEGYDFSGATALDIGCNAGYYAFRAARRGAIVTGIDKNKNILSVARTIQEHIEMTDVEFLSGAYTSALDRCYDYIFYLSVHHQHDERYEHLRATLKMLLRHCDTLFLELINPPLTGDLTKEDVDAIAVESGSARKGGKILMHYQHGVRRMRSVYVL